MTPGQVYAIDVGTSKIVAVSGRVEGRRPVEVLGVGESASGGMKRGVVVDREEAAEAILEAIEACEAPLVGRAASVGIAGGHVRSANVEVTLLNRDRDRRVTGRFIEKLEAEARAKVELEEDEEIVHVVPRSYVLDGAEGVTRPVGLSARQVTLRAHVVAAAVPSIQNLLGVVEDCGVKVARVVLEPLASGEACLALGDRSLGTALLDIGGGTTDIAAFVRGSLTHTAVVPIGGQSFSSDVSYGLKVPFEAAEELKKRYGTVHPREIDDVAAVPLDGQHYNARFISEILEYRAYEVLENARDSLDEAGVLDMLPGGAVLTGGGSLLEGMEELAEKVLGMRVRLAAPRRVRGDTQPLRKPQYSTAVGLLYYAAENNHRKPKLQGAWRSNFGSMVAAIRDWFRAAG